VSGCVQASRSSQGVPSVVGGSEQAPVAGLQMPTSWHASEAKQLTGFVPRHVPAWQASVCVQASPSSHGAPETFGGLLQIPVSGLQVPALWHGSDAVQVTAVPALQDPATQKSGVHWLESRSHDVPLGATGLEQTPVAGLQVPAVWQALGTGQTTGSAPVQRPDWQVSVFVHASPSLQETPSELGGLLQRPLTGLQTPASWHWSIAEQVTGDAPTQVPAWQVSDCVQASPSLQSDPLVPIGFEQAPVVVSQVPATWHWSWAVQVTGSVPVQVPPWHESACVQELPSSQSVPSGPAGLEQTPVAGLQVPATRHGPGTGQTTGLEPVQVPPWQVSVWVQASPSLQEMPSS
jgi:hypothetical protein